LGNLSPPPLHAEPVLPYFSPILLKRNKGDNERNIEVLIV
jgi:hypothetical protein